MRGFRRWVAIAGHISAGISQNAAVEIGMIPGHDQGAEPARTATRRRARVRIFGQGHIALLLH